MKRKKPYFLRGRATYTGQLLYSLNCIAFHPRRSRVAFEGTALCSLQIGSAHLHDTLHVALELQGNPESLLRRLGLQGTS